MKKNGIIINKETVTYYKNGKIHREDGPAVEYRDGTKEWWLNGNLHREDGPAVEWGNGYKEWWIDGEQITEEEFNQIQESKQA